MYCVIMGEIVNSRELAAEVMEKAVCAAEDVFDRLNSKYRESLLKALCMVRGDAFECVLLTQSCAPKIVREIIKAVYAENKTAVRICAVMGQLTAARAETGGIDGPAVHKARDVLESLKKRGSGHWLQVSFDVGEPGQSLVDGLLALLTALTGGWTDKQREIAWAMEKYGDYQKVVGKRLGVSPAVVSKQLKAASYDAYRIAWEGLTEHLEAMDEYAAGGGEKDSDYVPYYNIALRRKNQRDYPQALCFLETAYKQARKQLKENDPQYIRMFNLKAKILTHAGEYDEAGEAVSGALALQEGLPKARREYIETLAIQADVYYEKGEPEKAIEKYEEAIGLAQAVFYEGHSFIMALYNRLANACLYTGDFENAIYLFNKSLETAEKNSDKDPVSYAAAAYDIADCYYCAGNYEAAITYAEEALLLCEGHLPDKHEYTNDARMLLKMLEPHRRGLACNK